MRRTLIRQRNLEICAAGLRTRREKMPYAHEGLRPYARRVRRPAAQYLISCAVILVALAAGGCGSSKFRPIESEQEFTRQVLDAKRPALVYFTKDGCAACMFLNPCMDQLYDEYEDRVDFAEFSLMTFWSQVKCDRVWKRYRIAYFPTVVLFVNGKEKNRWVGEYGGGAYRKVLDEVAGPPPPKNAAARPAP